MFDCYIGEIKLFGGNFAPQNFAFCDGQLINIATNTALFSLLGTTYGGNGSTTFALPDLRGRLPMHPGTGPGLSTHDLGEASGTENVTLIIPQIPSHTHFLTVNNDTANIAATGAGAYLNSKTESGESVVSANAAAGVTANVASLSIVGANQPHTNMQPYLCLSFIICVQGFFPSRN